MFAPNYFDNGIPVYSKYMIDLYGPPNLSAYIVIDDSIEYLPSYNDINNRIENMNHIHRYDRIQRFNTILLQIIGDSRITSKKGLKCLKRVSKNLPHDYDLKPLSDIYQMVRHIMRRNGLKIYYNRIATILHEFNITDVRPHCSQYIVNNVIADFQKMHHKFNSLSDDMNRKYFPNLKYIALKLLFKYGFTNPFGLKLAKTPSRLQKLENDFKLIWDSIEEEELVEDLTSVFD
jgi:hypothetical protein